MEIRMLLTRSGSPDGFAVKRYHKGLIYHIPHTLGCAFLQKKWAVKMDNLSTEEAYLRIMMDLQNLRLAQQTGLV